MCFLGQETAENDSVLLIGLLKELLPVTLMLMQYISVKLFSTYCIVIVMEPLALESTK